jgi:predicted aspartyl protease
MTDLVVTVTPNNAVLVDGSIKGEAVKFQVDTGSYATIFDGAVVKRFGVSDSGPGGTSIGVGGETQYIRAKIPGLKLGSSDIDMYFNVINNHFLAEPVYGLLGEDFLYSFDLDIDLHANRIGLFNYNPCRTEPIYWANNFSEADLSIRANKIYVMVEVNGTPTRAVFDTGAHRSLIAAAFARRLGVDSGSAGATKSPDVHGVDGHRVPAFNYRFAELKVGDEVVKNPVMLVADLSPRKHDFNSMYRIQESNFTDDGMILGVDFIRQHHIYIATKEQKMYFTWNGGSIFAPPAEEAAASASGK